MTVLKSIPVIASLFLMTYQDTGVLRIRVTVDQSGTAIPIPRLLLLVSDNPSTIEPRRVRTGPDGVVELTLRPGLYTVESDQPLALGRGSYSWTEMVTVATGQTVSLDLSSSNADLSANASAGTLSGSEVLGQWQHSVVEIWTPLRHGAGFVLDASGAIATSYQTIGTATLTEVEFTTSTSRFKVQGRVVMADAMAGTAIVKVDPTLLAEARPVDGGCRQGRTAPVGGVELTAIAATMFGPKSLSGGAVTTVTPAAIHSGMSLSNESSGSPVFAVNGDLVGVGVLEETDSKGWAVASVIPIGKVCDARATAEKTFTAAATDPTRLPIEPAGAALKPTKLVARGPSAPKPQPVSVSSEDYEIRLFTPAHYRAGALPATPEWDCFQWADYVRYAPQLMLVRVTPKFDERLWKTLARGAAATQGVQLPPLRSFRSDFDRLTAFCDEQEVTPIHRLIVDRTTQTVALLRPYGLRLGSVKADDAMREGLYVFEPSAFGPQCTNVILNIYSAKDPKKADIKTIDAKLFQQVINSLQ